MCIVLPVKARPFLLGWLFLADRLALVWHIFRRSCGGQTAIDQDTACWPNKPIQRLESKRLTNRLSKVQPERSPCANVGQSG